MHARSVPGRSTSQPDLEPIGATMLWFVVAFSPDGSLSPDARAYLDASDVAELPFAPARHLRWCDAGGTAHFAGWETGAPPRVLVDGAGLVACAGLPRPRETDWPASRPVTEILRDAIRTWAWQPHEHLCDAYALVRLDDVGVGVVAMDPLGLHALYLAAAGAATVIGNRPDVVAEVAARQSGRAVRRDPSVGVWMALASYRMDDGTGFDGVTLLPQHTTANVHRGAVTFDRAEAAYACDPDEQTHDPDELAEELAAEVAAALRYAIARSPGRPHLELTGGKDSRLVLSIALRAGLADAFTCVTYGPEALPDMQVARDVAARCGLVHEDVSAAHLEGSLSLPIAERYMRHVQRTCGNSELGNANEPSATEVLTASGMLGEIYRTSSDRQAADPPRTWEDAAERFWSERRLGSLGLLRPAAASGLSEQAVEYYLEPRAAVPGPEALRHAFFVRCRLPRWQGPLVDLHQRRVLPLYSPAAIRASFRIGHHAAPVITCTAP